MKVWCQLRHSNILPLLGFYLSENLDLALVVCPYEPLGDVPHYLKSREVSLEKKLDLVSTLSDPPQNPLHAHTPLTQCLDALNGLKYLHEQGFCHGDIKPVREVRRAQGSHTFADLVSTPKGEPSRQQTGESYAIRFWAGQGYGARRQLINDIGIQRIVPLPQPGSLRWYPTICEQRYMGSRLHYLRGPSTEVICLPISLTTPCRLLLGHNHILSRPAN